jgi:hypothetical protein
LSSATRSNRFRTFLLAAVEPELRRLECCDMAKPSCSRRRAAGRADVFSKG